MQSYYYRDEDLEAELTLPIFFTPKQANEFLPQVRETVQQVISIKKETDSLKDDNEMTGAMERLEKEIQKFHKAGMAEVITKPINRTNFYRILKKYLEQN